MHKLLIEKEMDGFTVVELRNASISIDSSFVDLDDARRKVYRQILRFMSNNATFKPMTLKPFKVTRI